MAERPPEIHRLSEADHARLASAVMRRQAALSLRIAAGFIVLVFGLPLVNFYLPDLADTRLLGFTATWLFLAVVFYPITWILSYAFIRASDRIEAECPDWRAVLGAAAGEPLEPDGVGDVKPAFIETDVDDEAGR